MPARFGTPGSVRAKQTPQSDTWAHVVHTFWPVSTHSSPSGSARVASEARSEPAPGSLKSWHHFSLLSTMRGRNRSRCSSVPWANSAGAHRLRPSGFSRPRPYGASTASIARAVSGGRSSPPYSRGHVGTTSPEAAKVGYQASYSAKVRTSRSGRPAAAACRHTSGTCSSTQARASAASATLIGP